MYSETDGPATFTFHCLDEEGGWLGFHGPVLLEHDEVMDCVASVMAGAPRCSEVTVWVEDERVLTVCRAGGAPVSAAQD